MNYYTIVTGDRFLPCSEEIRDRIKTELNKEDPELGALCGLSVDWLNGDSGEKGKIHLHSDESFFIEAMSQDLLDMIGQLVKEEGKGKKYIEFGAAEYGSRPAPDSSSGFHFRVYDDGSIDWPTTYWDDDPTHKAMMLLARIALSDADNQTDMIEKHGYNDEFLKNLHERMYKATEDIDIG